MSGKSRESETKKRLEQYQELQRQIAALEAQKSQIAGQIKAYMEMMGVEEIQVNNTTARYQEVTSNRLDTSALKEKHPRIYRMFCKPQTVRRLLVT